MGVRKTTDLSAILRLAEEGKNDEQIAALLGMSKSGVRYARLKHKSKDWSERECEYLANNYGLLSDEKLAENMKRRVSEVRAQAEHMCLGSKLDNADGVTASYIAGLLWGEQSNTYQKRLMDMGVPYRMICYSQDEQYCIINIDKFFKWAKKHKDELNFCKFERFALGKEPSWVDEKRRADWREYTRRRWASYA